MKKTELTLCILSAIGIILYLLPVPGGSMLTVLALTLLSLLYFFFGFALFNGIRGRDLFKGTAYTGISALKIVGGVGVGMSLSTVIIGILFRVMMWPGGSFMILIGCAPVIIVCIIAWVRASSSNSPFAKRVLARAAVFGGLGVLCFMVSSITIIKVKYRDYPEYVRAVEQVDADPENEALQQKAQEEYDKMQAAEE
ncbi:hypothetical protein OGH69_12335 [Flavobacterium sp. MFBS3-15]|uniref:hypothetical protein n=1 Tax=Flavobacterium sp. MFBS3-15 TaxID=2989816 RepID=UPI002235D281|nr:hypothetical protein [Flavobacterium sp. MFBS3-15]MCW4469759.1 hypothetical protein [Flavobacterium sp. MFBS3-15]